MSGTRHTFPFDVVGIVGSQGALPAARTILGYLPQDFPAAVIYVQHRVAKAGTVLRDLLGRSSAMPVRVVEHGDAVRAGTIHVPAADVLTTVEPGGFHTREGRCLGDPLLRGLAAVYGPRSVAVVLSGRLNDGAIGLRAVKEAGGLALVQSPESAESDSMPLAALATGCCDWALTPRQIGEALVALATVPGAAELLAVRSHPLVSAPTLLASRR